MGVPLRYVLHQGPVLRGMGEAVLTALAQRAGLGSARAPQLPGPEHRITVPPRPEDLVTAYLQHVGGEAERYRGRVPAHLFPQWAFPLTGKLVRGLDYPLLSAMNGGCRLVLNAPLRAGVPLEVSGRLESIDDDGRRAILDQRLVTGTAEAPEAVVAHLYVFIPLGRGKAGNSPRGPKEKPRVPSEARELTSWRLGPEAGLDFAKLTGDFNPVHWIPAWSRAFGFKHTILHGFGTLARAIEGLNRGLFAGEVDALREIDVRFTRPLVLPARVGLYVQDNRVWVGDAPGEPAYLEGTFHAGAKP